MNYVVLTFILIFSVSSGIELNAQNYFEQLPSNLTDKDVRCFADSIHRMGKEAIPLLIADIDRKDKVKIGLGKPYWSNLHPTYFEENYRGIRSAYFIEFLLRGEHISKFNRDLRVKNKLTATNYSKNHFMYRVDYYYLRYNNIIVNKNSQKLNYKQMKAVKKIYEKWWKKNKHKSISELRNEFRGKGVLLDCPFKWI